MKEKYVKLKSVLDILYDNKTIDDSCIDHRAIDEILALPTEEIETNQEPNVINEKKYDLLKLLKDYKDYNYWNTLNESSYIPEYCKACPNHPSNGGSGNCNCILGTPQVFC